MIDAPEAEDLEYDPITEPKSSRGWLNLIVQAEKAFADYQHRADNIDKLYADLARLSKIDRSREFQLFWANISVLGPSIYARPPVPVVVPKFKDRRPLYRASSELLERSSMVAFDLADINSIMLLVRDDLTILGRGAPWVRYETKAESDTPTERICIDFKNRRDFLHDPARHWGEVGWVAGASYLTKKEMKKRFKNTSGDVYLDAEYAVQKEDKERGAADNRQRAKVWELWSKDENKVVWVAKGCDKVLDEGEPHLKLEGFFPCPKPAYATVQRGSLIPVPDMLYYKDQLEEINELTGRIAALSESLKVRGFYPAGQGEAGDAIEAAIKSLDDRQVMVPISNFAAFGSGSSELIVWLPIDMIATTLQGLVELRKQLIDDVYQIMGLSDIMRGSTDAKETLGAQELKSQYGSVRIRDKQSELVRIARDLVRISAEIMAENFSKQTLLDMSQMEIPSDADIAKQIKGLTEQAAQIKKAADEQFQKAQANPQMMQQAQASPEQAQQLVEQLKQQTQQQLDGLKQQAQKLQETVTIEQVMKFLKDQKLRPFVLDIETDSTIQPDENAEKQARTEFVTALGGTLQQFLPMVQQMPQTAPLFGEILKFALAPFRAGRELEGKIDEAVDQMSAIAQNPPPNPEAEKAKVDQAREDQRFELDAKAKEQDAQLKQTQAAHDAQLKEQAAQQDAQNKQAQSEITIKNLLAKGQMDAQKHQQEMQKGALDLRIREIELAALQTPEQPAETPAKPPSESIAFKDLPPEGQAQMAAQAGITLSSQQMADHQAEQDAKKQAEMAMKAKQNGNTSNANR